MAAIKIEAPSRFVHAKNRAHRSDIRCNKTMPEVARSTAPTLKHASGARFAAQCVPQFFLQFFCIFSIYWTVIVNQHPITTA